MQKRLSSIPAPALAGVIREKTKKAAVAQAKNCLYAGADMMDLHLSCLDCTEAEYLAPIIRASEVPVLALNYNLTYENEKLGLTEEERVASMLRAIEAGAAGMDLQGYTFHAPSKEGFCGEDTYSFTKGNPRRSLRTRASSPNSAKSLKGCTTWVRKSSFPAIPASP